MNGTFTQPVVPITAGTNGGFGGCGNEFIWIFALLILGGGGFGGFGGNRGAEQAIDNFELGKLTGSVATKDSVQMLTNQMDNQFAQTLMNVFNVRDQLGNGLSTLGFDLASRIATLSSLVSNCCCEIKTMMLQGFSDLRYEGAQNTNAILMAIKDGNREIFNKMASDKEQMLYSRINALERDASLCGIVRYPNAMTYNAGGSPFCGPNCAY